MIGKSHFIYLLLMCVLAVGIGVFFSTDRKAETICHTTTDTLFVYKTDTIIEYRTKYKTKHTIDTLYVETQNKPILSLPVEQKHFAKANYYDLWISGVEPLKMDSIKLYQQTEYITITNDVVKEIFPKRTEYYVFGGLNAIDGTFVPKIGISIKTKENWLISPEIGLYDNKAYYGLTIGKKFK